MFVCLLHVSLLLWLCCSIFWNLRCQICSIKHWKQLDFENTRNKQVSDVSVLFFKQPVEFNFHSNQNHPSLNTRCRKTQMMMMSLVLWVNFFAHFPLKWVKLGADICCVVLQELWRTSYDPDLLHSCSSLTAVFSRDGASITLARVFAADAFRHKLMFYLPG